jgi:PAS domain S-box-containing protein
MAGSEKPSIGSGPQVAVLTARDSPTSQTDGPVQGRPHPLLRYGFSLLAVSAALGIRQLIAPVTGGEGVYLAFVVAVMAAAWYGGLGPGLLAIVASLAAIYAVVPRSRLEAGGILLVVLFTVQGAIVSAVCEVRRRAAVAREDLLRAELESERRFRIMADHAPVLIWMSGDDALYTYFNRPWLEFTGRLLEQEVGNGWTEGIHPLDRQRCAESYLASFQARVPFQLEYRLRRSDGQFRWVLDFGVPRYGPRREFLGYIGSCVDITERREVELRTRRLNDELERRVTERTNALEATNDRLQLSERLAAIGTLAAGLGHDIHNLILPMRCRLDALFAADLGDEAGEHLEGIAHAVEYLDKLTSALRGLAKNPLAEFASGALTLLPQWWSDISPLLRMILRKDIDLISELPSGLPPLAIPSHALTQAVVNLVTNAGDAIVGTGRVRVWARLVAGEGPLRRAQVGVTDNGPGMVADVRNHALDPFFTTKTRQFSTGLGLPLVNAIVAAVGGWVEIDSAAGKGTTVILTIPVVKQETGEAVAPGSESEERRVATIAVRDARLAALMAAMLRPLGFDLAPDSQHDRRDGGLLITEPVPGAYETACRYLQEGPSRRVIVVGGDGEEWRRIGAMVVDLSQGTVEIRDAILAAAKPPCAPR